MTTGCKLFSVNMRHLTTEPDLIFRERAKGKQLVVYESGCQRWKIYYRYRTHWNQIAQTITTNTPSTKVVAVDNLSNFLSPHRRPRMYSTFIHNGINRHRHTTRLMEHKIKTILVDLSGTLHIDQEWRNSRIGGSFEKARYENWVIQWFRYNHVDLQYTPRILFTLEIAW